MEPMEPPPDPPLNWKLNFDTSAGNTFLAMQVKMSLHDQQLEFVKRLQSYQCITRCWFLLDLAKHRGRFQGQQCAFGLVEEQPPLRIPVGELVEVRL